MDNKLSVNIHKNLFVFDIETVPDEQVVRNLFDCEKEGIDVNDVQTMRQKLIDYHLEITEGKNDFVRQLFHKVVAVSFAEIKIDKDMDGHEIYEIVDIRSGGKVDSNEEEIVRGFFYFLSKRLPRIVSFNGRTFDLPVMRYRAMKYGISVPWLYQSGDKWANYLQRYSTAWHCDLLDSLCDFGASAHIKMNEVCAILNLPGKLGIDGSMVSSMYDAGKIQEIRDYCETDVINTYLVYLNYQLHRGEMDLDGFQHSIQDLAQYLYKYQADKPHFAEFMQAWYNTDLNDFYHLPTVTDTSLLV